MNKKQAYFQALDIVNNYLGLPSDTKPKNMGVENAAKASDWLDRANFLTLVGCLPVNGSYNASKNELKVYSGLCTVMWQCRNWGNRKNKHRFLYAPTGRPFTFEETQENGIHIDEKLTPLPRQTFTRFDYYKGNK